jgi:PDZ domain
MVLVPNRLCAVAAGLMVWSALATAQQAKQPASGGATGSCATPDSIAIRGLSRAPDADIRAALGIAPKSTIDGRAVTQAVKNLDATNRFESNVAATCELIGGKSVLVFNVTERRATGTSNPRPLLYGFALECRDCEPGMRGRVGGGGRGASGTPTYKTFPHVIAVAPGTAADRAGIRPGDELHTIDGLSLLTPGGAQHFEGGLPGQKVELGFERDARPISVSMVLGAPLSAIPSGAERIASGYGAINGQVHGNIRVEFWSDDPMYIVPDSVTRSLTFQIGRGTIVKLQVTPDSTDPANHPGAKTSSVGDSDLVRVGYVQRKQTTAGFFVDSSDIDRRSPLFSDAVRALPGLRATPIAKHIDPLTGRPTSHTNVITTASDGCVTTFVDGAAFQPMTPGDIDEHVGATQLIAIELYQPPNVPPQFVRRDEPSCATLVVWTQALRRRRR